MDEKEIMQKISSYSYNAERLRELRDQILSICPKITATYGNLSGTTGGNSFSSKVEDMGNRRYDLKKKELVYKRKVDAVANMIEKSGLDDREKELMWWIAHSGKLQAYARREHIGRDNIYKIRDRAIKKIAANIKLQNVV